MTVLCLENSENVKLELQQCPHDNAELQHNVKKLIDTSVKMTNYLKMDMVVVGRGEQGHPHGGGTPEFRKFFVQANGPFLLTIFPFNFFGFFE
jgi:hypothetical protein